MQFNDILIQNGAISVPEAHEAIDKARTSDALFTVLVNMAYFGFAPASAAYLALGKLTANQLTDWWAGVEPHLRFLTGDDRNMGEFVVYRNFPSEVLSFEENEWIIRQILIYIGAPYDCVRDDAEIERPALDEIARLKILALAGPTAVEDIYTRLVALPSRWTDNQTAWAARIRNGQPIDLAAYGFKENGINEIAKAFGTDAAFDIGDATDVIRLAAALSDQEVSLRGKIAFRKFTRRERRRLLALLDQTANIGPDFALRPELAKRLMERLRPGDYMFENVKAAYDDLYNGRLKSFNALIDPQEPSPQMLAVALARPGEFLRRFHHLFDMFGDRAVEAFSTVMDKLTSKQLVGLRGYLRSINDRKTLIYPPRGSWTKAQVVENGKNKIPQEVIDNLDARIGAILGERLAVAFPEGLALGEGLDTIKLQTNDQKLAEYGRGTSFAIPDGITFVRSASFWQEPKQGVIWFDNGWNFFGDGWEAKGAVAWDDQDFENKGAIMSGDPINMKDHKGRGCQMIDLYLDKLVAAGVRYAVWNILAYSHVKFSEAEEVLATLQWGENAETGKLYEPARAQMVFPLKSEAETSYVAYIDLVERRLVYMDAALRGRVSSATENTDILAGVMPAYVEYLGALPSLFDLVQDAPKGTMPVLFGDSNVAIENERAFVFRPENAENVFEPVALSAFLG